MAQWEQYIYNQTSKSHTLSAPEDKGGPIYILSHKHWIPLQWHIPPSCSPFATWVVVLPWDSSPQTFPGIPSGSIPLTLVSGQAALTAYLLWVLATQTCLWSEFIPTLPQSLWYKLLHNSAVSRKNTAKTLCLLLKDPQTFPCHWKCRLVSIDAIWPSCHFGSIIKWCLKGNMSELWKVIDPIFFFNQKTFFPSGICILTKCVVSRWNP